MTIQDIKNILHAEILWADEEMLSHEVHTACGSDMMSDVLAFVKDQAVLLTGLVNPQVIRTAEMMDIVCIVFVRGKMPDPSMIGLAEERGIALLSCGQRMFTACTRAGEASSSIKKALKQVGLAPDIIRNVAIAMYEGEINMVIHAGGGQIDVDIAPDAVRMVLKDQGPGIQDISLAMQAGWSTAPDDVRSLGFGAGMGLPNMKKYTDEMKIESTVGVGTTVSMTVFTHPQEEAVS